MQVAGVNVLNQAFVAEGNIATAGGCLSAQYISTWIINRLKGRQAIREVLHYFAPDGEQEVYLARALAHLDASSN